MTERLQKDSGTVNVSMTPHPFSVERIDCEVSAGDFCSIYRPVYLSHSDTPQTKSQTTLFMSVWLDLCSEKKLD